MPHILSVAAQAANDSPNTMTRDLFIITLPDPVSPITLHLATADVTVDSQFYLGDIRKMPGIWNTYGGDSDGGEFSIDNADNDYGPTFITSDRQLDGAEVVHIRAFKLADGTWEKEDPISGLTYEIARGTLTTRPVSDTEVECTITADTSDASVNIGGDIIPQHCPETFNENGNHPLGGNCGWKPTFLQKQVETSIIEGTITGAGNVRIIVTASGMSGGSATLDVAVLAADNAAAIAGKLRAALAADGIVNAFFDIAGIGQAVKVIAKTPAVIDNTMNISVANLTSAGLVNSLVSQNTSSTFCSKLANDPEGCSGHGNTRHSGVPGLTPTAATGPANTTPNEPNGGYGEGVFPQRPIILDSDANGAFGRGSFHHEMMLPL